MTYHAFIVCDTGTYRAKMLIKHVLAIYVLVLAGKYIELSIALALGILSVSCDQCYSLGSFVISFVFW